MVSVFFSLCVAGIDPGKGLSNLARRWGERFCFPSVDKPVKSQTVFFPAGVLCGLLIGAPSPSIKATLYGQDRFYCACTYQMLTTRRRFTTIEIDNLE